MKKEVAILTKSSKYKGYCVAGIDVNTGEWVRFVSDNEQTHGALSAYDISYADRHICKPLDVVLVEVVEAVPLAHQPENYLINSREYWKKQVSAHCLMFSLFIQQRSGHTYMGM